MTEPTPSERPDEDGTATGDEATDARADAAVDAEVDAVADAEVDAVASASLDGAATEAEDARVARDPRLQARCDELRAAAQAIGAPVAVPDDDSRERAVAAALTEADHTGLGRPSPPRELAAARRRRRQARPWVPAVAAALVILALAVPAVLALGGLGDGDESADEEAATSSGDEGDAAEGPAARDAAPPEPPGDAGAAQAPRAGGPVQLGAFPDIEALVAEAEARPELALRARGFADQADVVPAEVGPPAQRCDEFLRAVSPELGPLTATAGASVDSEPVLVLRYALPDGSAQRYVVTVTACDVLDARRDSP